MEDLDYKEIKKQHLEMMNTEIKHTHETSNIGYNNTLRQPIMTCKPYYFEFNTEDSQNQEYKSIEINYVIPGTHSKLKLYLDNYNLPI